MRGQEGACGEIPVFNGVWAVAAVEKVELSVVESTMEAAAVVADEFCFPTVGNQICAQLSSRFFGSKR